MGQTSFVTDAILALMATPRNLLLFDPNAHPQSWNERMTPGEYAILYSDLRTGTADNPEGPFCTVFSTLAEAEAYAAEQVTMTPTLLCRIYDHQGLGYDPVREIRGSQHKGESEISARFRRWGGCGMFFGGIALIVLDWSRDFSLNWPAMVGVRIAPVGLILLITEFVLVFEARRRRRRDGQTVR
ncbi:MAG TPA: hypothetical protein VIX90_10670 [Edaphobacter sp.]